MISMKTSISQHKFYATDRESNSLTRLSRGEVAYCPDQSITLHPLSYGPISKVALIRSAKIEHVTHGIKPISPALKPVNLVTAVVRGAVIGSTGSIYPVQAFISGNDTFPKVRAQVENNVESKELSYPRLRRSEKCLKQFLSTKISDKCAAVSRQPSRDIGEPFIIHICSHVEFGKERAELGQSRVALLHEMAEILSAASRKLAQKSTVLFAGVWMSWIVGSLPMERLVDRVISEGIRHAMSLFYELFRFSARPAEHGRLHC